MARYSHRAVEKILKVLFFVTLLDRASLALVPDQFAPEFNSLTQKSPVDYEDSKKIVFEVRGRNIHSGIKIKATKDKSDRDTECEDLKVLYNVSEIQTFEFQKAQYELTVPKNVQGNIYLCLPRKVRENTGQVPSLYNSVFYKWYHQGPGVFVDVTSNKTELE